MALQVMPEILNLPDKLIPIVNQFNDYRYFLLEGGRGGAKSQSVGRFILFLAEKYKIRVVCGRETQNSINESVYSLLVDLIREHQLAFDIFSTKIISKISKSEINFRGFREQGRFNIQGMEGIDIVWIDEAQAITKQTLDVLIPTIRKEKAKIFFTMNRHVVDDPVFETFDGRSDCLHIHINYPDNKFCTKALIREAEECKKKSVDDYNHIWLGIPLDKSEDALYTFSELENSKINKYSLRPAYGLRIAGFDIARYGDDKCAAVVIQQMGALHWEEIYCDEWGHKDLNFTTGKILQIINEQKVNKAIIDEDGLGSGPLDTLQVGRGLDQIIGFRNPSISYQDNKDYANNRTVWAYRLKDMLVKEHIKLNDHEMIKELLNAFKYTFDHQQRKILISKEIMRTKFKIKSPNKADALIMAISRIDEVKQAQEQQYRTRQQPREESLFALAGVR